MAGGAHSSYSTYHKVGCLPNLVVGSFQIQTSNFSQNMFTTKPKSPSPRPCKQTYASILTGPPTAKHEDNLPISAPIKQSDVDGFCLKPTSTYLGKPAVFFSDSDKDSLIQRLQYVLVAKFSHGRPSLACVKEFLRIFNLKSLCNISVYDSKHLIMECEAFEDYVKLWNVQQCLVGGFKMRFFKWREDFHPSFEAPICPVWVHLPGLPLYLYQEDALMSIANAIGRPLALDLDNINRSKLGCASFCVEVDVSIEVIDKIWIAFDKKDCCVGRQGFWQNVIFDPLPHYCKRCAHLGHSTDCCLRMDNMECKILREDIVEGELLLGEECRTGQSGGDVQANLQGREGGADAEQEKKSTEVKESKSEGAAGPVLKSATGFSLLGAEQDALTKKTGKETAQEEQGQGKPDMDCEPPSTDSFGKEEGEIVDEVSILGEQMLQAGDQEMRENVETVLELGEPNLLQEPSVLICINANQHTNAVELQDVEQQPDGTVKATNLHLGNSELGHAVEYAAESAVQVSRHPPDVLVEKTGVNTLQNGVGNSHGNTAAGMLMGNGFEQVQASKGMRQIDGMLVNSTAPDASAVGMPWAAGEESVWTAGRKFQGEPYLGCHITSTNLQQPKGLEIQASAMRNLFGKVDGDAQMVQALEMQERKKQLQSLFEQASLDAHNQPKHIPCNAGKGLPQMEHVLYERVEQEQTFEEPNTAEMFRQSTSSSTVTHETSQISDMVEKADTDDEEVAETEMNNLSGQDTQQGAGAAREGCWADLVEEEHEEQLAREHNDILEWDAAQVKAFVHKQIEEIKQEIGQIEPKIRVAAKEEKKEMKQEEIAAGEAERVRKSTAQKEKQLARELKFVRERKNLKEYFRASAEKINSDFQRKRSEKKEKTTWNSFKYGEG